MEFVHGDVADPAAARAALEDVDAVYHDAAAVGVGQSMYRIADYVRANSLGAAVLLEAMVARREADPPRGRREPHVALWRGPDLTLSMATLPRRCAGPRAEAARRRDASPTCGREAEALPTPESKPLQPTSVYAVTKRDHEELFLAVGAAYGIPTVALRYFNVYGPRQSLGNPYTGVAAIFASRLLNDRPPADLRGRSPEP